MSTRILIVDDNLDIHGDFKKILAPTPQSSALRRLESALFGSAPEADAESYQLDFASQGLQAIELVRTAVAQGRPYGMAFVDVRMPPGLDGVETIVEIRKIDPVMQFALCTAYSDYTPEEARQKLGISNGLLFIVKPFEADTVREVARTMSTRPEFAAAV